MERQWTTPRDQLHAHLAGADWAELTKWERAAGRALAREEGQRAAQEDLGPPAREGAPIVALRASRWAREHGGLDRLDDATLYVYASAQTLACEHAYVEHVIEPRWPERAAWWWGCEIEERRADPRVCAFCDAYERERRRILGLPRLPTEIAGLEHFLSEAKEQERESARAWMKTVETSYTSEAYGDRQRLGAEWEYQRCQLCTDLAQMLLDVASYPRCGIGERRPLPPRATAASGPPSRSRSPRR